MTNTSNVLLTLALVCATFLVRAEGTPELLAYNCSNFGSIQIWDNADINRKFATWNAPEEFRLHIRVSAGEQIHMGFGNLDGDVWWRLKDPAGTVVMGPNLVGSGSGAITSCTKAMTGPKSLLSGGYTDALYTALMSGDYYVEFAQNADPTLRDKRIIEWFDITVSDGTNPIPGRVWSRAWDINCQGGANTFEAAMYAYSADSVVTKFSFNGIRPHGFTISCNSFGVSDVGTFAERRRSDYRNNVLANGGRPSAPEYPLFLNEPDPTHFPEGQFGIIDSFSLHTCNSGQNCIWVYTNKAGQVEVVLEFPDGTQRNMIDTVPAGGKCFEWNGESGSGTPMEAFDTVHIRIHYATGITHLPLMDVENHAFGYNVELIRPTTKPNGEPIAPPLIFWNDSLLTDPENSLDGIANLEGASGGSHRWIDRGTNNSNPEVINTWWYSSLEENTFLVVCPVLLPLEMGPFTGKYLAEANHVDLTWSTYTESELDQYTVERSADGYQFEQIGTVSAMNTGATYQFRDVNVSTSKDPVYYRLRIVDLNGRSEYSRVIMIQVNGTIPTYLSWDPQTGGFAIRSDQEVPYQYTLHDLTGKTIQSGTARTNEPLTVSTTASGIFLLHVRLSGQDGYQTHKVFLR